MGAQLSNRIWRLHDWRGGVAASVAISGPRAAASPNR